MRSRPHPSVEPNPASFKKNSAALYLSPVAARLVRDGLWWRDAALRRACPRIFRSPHHGNGVRRRDDGNESRHGFWAVGRRDDFRYVRQLYLALYRFAECRFWRDGGGVGVPATALPVA